VQAAPGYLLQMGCGREGRFPRLPPGWTNIDKRYDNQVLGPVDILEGVPLRDGACSYVYSEDLFEHFGQRDQLVVLGEIFRLLEPGASFGRAAPA